MRIFGKVYVERVLWYGLWHSFKMNEIPEGELLYYKDHEFEPFIETFKIDPNTLPKYIADKYTNQT